MIFHKTFCLPLRVEFEDVDMYGVLHHPKYLAYLERGRSQMLEDCHLSVKKLAEEYHGIVISDLYAKYLRPAHIGDSVFVCTRMGAIRAASMLFIQWVQKTKPDLSELKNVPNSELLKVNDILFYAELRFASVDLKGHKPVRIPKKVRDAFHLPELEKEIPDEFRNVQIRGIR